LASALQIFSALITDQQEATELDLNEQDSKPSTKWQMMHHPNEVDNDT